MAKKSKDWYAYIAVFNYTDDGIAIEFPDLPGCLPCADDTETALKNAKEAMGVHLFGMERDGDTIPEPSPLSTIALENGDVPVLVEVFMPAVRERIKNRFVKKTLSLPAWLSAMADESGINCSKVFQNALMETLGVTSAGSTADTADRGVSAV